MVSFVTLWAALPATQPTAAAVAGPAILYFSAATAVMALCAVAYAHMWKLPYVRYRWGLDGAPHAQSLISYWRRARGIGSYPIGEGRGVEGCIRGRTGDRR